jgi:hypothetical protein
MGKPNSQRQIREKSSGAPKQPLLISLQTDNVAVSDGGRGGGSAKQITLTVESIRFSPQWKLDDSPLPVLFCFKS